MSGSQETSDGSSGPSAGFDPETGREARQTVDKLREEAVLTVTEGIYQQLGDQLAAFGEAGKAKCRDDIHAHLDYLIASLVAGASRPFGDYMAWLAKVLEAREVPTRSLTLSMDRLEAFFRPRMAEDQFAAVASVLEAGRNALGDPGSGSEAFQPPVEREPTPPVAVELVDSLIRGNREDARAILEASRREEGYLGMAVGWVEPALRRVGELWQARQISVADEHLATAHAQRLLTEQFVNADARPPHEGRALFACVPTNQHEVGLRILADSFELAGWRTEFLGADTPVPALVERVEQFRPEVIGLSVALARQIPQLQAAVAALRQALGSDCPRVIAGGPGLIGLSGAAERLGLDACYAQPQQALEDVS